MKTAFYIFGISLVVVLVNSGIVEDSQKYYNECKVEVDIEEEKLHGPPKFDDPKFKCFQACIAKKHGRVVDGIIVLEKALEFGEIYFGSTDERMKSEIKECVRKGSELTDECEMVATVGKCITEISRSSWNR